MTLITWLFAFVLAAAQAPSAAPQRFDYLVRADFFAGAAGNEARLQQAIDLCERALAENPKHPEALVWHGASLLVRSGQAFAKGDMANGGALFGRGLKEMDDAVGLAADNPGVLIPRAAVLFEATKNMPPDAARPLIQSAIANYEHVLDVQRPGWTKLGEHGKGEVLFGLAEGFARLGQPDKARMYFERLIKDAPTSGQVPKAKEWMASGTISKANGMSCVGCHK